MTNDTTKVAIITGGTSGCGLAVGRALAEHPEWKVYLLGTNEQKGQEAVKDIPRAFFCKANVTNYDALASTFHKVFAEQGRLDFAFANAGKFGMENDFYKQPPAGEMPPKPDLGLIDINVTSVIWTTYLALHYFRQSPKDGTSQRNLIITGSANSLYQSELNPVYAATKHALVGLTRSIAKPFHNEDIRVNILAPGLMKTSILSDELYSLLPADLLLPVEHFVNVTLDVLSGNDMVDTKGTRVSGSQLFGRTLEITDNKYYFREQEGFSDEFMKRSIGLTDLSLGLPRC
ncbi:NAD(P)-binding protein [Aspergillus ambiguus]|uniref:NAD(P)-binding protein n=1 Tax=Aspergillus ambiguus TaxID=176160 RepID=UPI003CCE0AD5